MGEKKGKRRFFLWALMLAVVGGVVAMFRRRRGQGIEESEWQELPPPEGG
ncbi:MAG: hypothetical protein M3245_03960 [Actinomycetota bacterium]|nr:hypothetical protein [Actinomycetota bacterium]